MKNLIIRSPVVVLVNLVSPNYLERYQSPLAVNTLANYLTNKLPNQHIVKIDMQKIFKTKSINSSIEENLPETIEETIKEIENSLKEGPVIIGLSIKWSSVDVAKQIIAAFSNLKNVLFVLGNCEVTFNYNNLLNDPCFKNCIAVVGEGEDALVEITRTVGSNLNDFQNLMLYTHIPNVAVKINDRIIIRDFARINLTKYSQSSTPDCEEIFDEEYEYYAIETSRGCPWGSCTFCAIKNQFGIPTNGKRTDWTWKPFSIDAILENIKSYVAKGVRIFDIKDSEFFGPVKKNNCSDPFFNNMDRVIKFSEGIIKLNKELAEKIKINHISCRVDTIFSEGEDEKNKIRLATFKLLKEAGVESIFLGIESGSPTQLKRYSKGVTVNENENAIKILESFGFSIEPGFIMFDPLVSLDELKENINFIERTQLYQYDSHILGSLRLQNGSPYVKLTESKGLLLEQINDTLTFNYNFLNSDVKIIESTFAKYEGITRKLLKFLSKKLRSTGYKNDFYLLKGLVTNYGYKTEWNNTLSEYIKNTEHLMQYAKYDIEFSNHGIKNLNLSREYLEQAIYSLYALKQSTLTKSLLLRKPILAKKQRYQKSFNIKPNYNYQNYLHS